MSNEKGLKGRETRQRLLRIAEEEFALHGYHETKISEIVKKADLTQPAFYIYFSSKEAIYEELVRQFHTGLIDLIESSRIEPGLRQGEISPRVTFVLERILGYLNDNRSLTQIGFIQDAEAETIKKTMAGIIADNLRSEQEHGYFRKEPDMEVVAHSLVGVIDRLTVTQLLTDRLSPGEVARQIVDLFLNGIQTETP
ncbi:TetR/AcrR family transcriptional regulator [Cohnella cellulosilytica]|uniref:TetR/AcrR family transcriptional regulator n=1 Tax=Cohnella cellulosilytica TaxID=986710 RepID=A0ABW2FB37_9BACL